MDFVLFFASDSIPVDGCLHSTLPTLHNPNEPARVARYPITHHDTEYGIPFHNLVQRTRKKENWARSLALEAMANEQVNIPSLIVILVLSGLIVRYLFFSSPAGTSRTSSSPSSNLAGSGQRSGADTLLRAREVAAERIMQMFPQVDRRAVLWDLQRTGGSLAATTERILAGRLETVSFFF